MELNKTFLLNPYYTLRNDKKRIILCKNPSFKVPFDIAEDDIFVFTHPVFAIILSLFNGKDNLEIALNKMSKILNSSIEDCYGFITLFFENQKRIGIQYDGVSFEFPKMILLDNQNKIYKYREFESDFTTKLEKHQSRAMCSANVSQLCILNDGRVTICEELYWNKKFLIGNILHNSIKEIWQSDKARNLYNINKINFSKDSKCKTCSDFDNCRTTLGVCWSNVVMAYGEEHWDFPSPNCPHSPLPYHSIHHN